MDEYPRHPEILKEGIKAVFGFMDPPEYQRDLQIVIDAVLHHGAISDDTESVVLRERGGPQLPLYFSGPDLLYVNGIGLDLARACTSDVSSTFTLRLQVENTFD